MHKGKESFDDKKRKIVEDEEDEEEDDEDETNGMKRGVEQRSRL